MLAWHHSTSNFTFPCLWGVTVMKWLRYSDFIKKTVLVSPQFKTSISWVTSGWIAITPYNRNKSYFQMGSHEDNGFPQALLRILAQWPKDFLLFFTTQRSNTSFYPNETQAFNIQTFWQASSIQTIVPILFSGKAMN